MKKRVVIFYISKYSGHFQAAKAIENAFKELGGNFEIELINAFNYTNPILGKVITKTYMEVIKKKPAFWGNIYDNPEILKTVVKIRDLLHRYNSPKMKRLMERHRPDIVYCTQAFPCGMIADYKSTFNKKVPLVAVLTDHAPHSYWIFDEVDAYVVPSKKTGDVLEQKGCPSEKILNYGIPVDMRFKKNHEKDVIKKHYGLLDNRPIVMVMGGSQGLGAIEGVVKSLRGEEVQYSLLVVAGKNKRLYRRLHRMVSGGDMPVKVFPYVERIEELMEISDVIVTKAGGITTAEALTKKLPMIIIDPIPGQERMNTEFLLEQGAAIEVDSVDQIRGALDNIFNSRDLLGKMKENAARIAKPDSALKIAELALRDF
jgi:processive 1,2-diacylglycerol beta-glucosyltransferase